VGTRRGHRGRARWVTCGLVTALVVVATPLVAVGSAVAAPAPAWSLQPATYGTGDELDQPVTMSDGTVLRADVYYPTDPATGAAAPGPFPVLLQQTPYGKDVVSGSALSNTGTTYFAERGFIVVIADVRGTGDSGGDFDLLDPVQGSDGATLARWAAALPHSDGKVGLFGESYMGIDQFLTVAAAGPDSPIKAMFPVIAGNELFADTVTQGGIPDIEFSALYVALLSGLNLTNPALEPLILAAEDRDYPALAGGLARLTPEEISHSSTLVSFLQMVLDVETGQGSPGYNDAYWAARSPASTLAAVVADHIPAFLVGGWNDLFQAGEPLNYVGLQNLWDHRPQTASMRPDQPVTPRYQLLMGPWMHVTTGDGINLSALEVEWFDTWLLGEDTPLATTTTPVHLEELNSGPESTSGTTGTAATWVDAAQWPLPQTTATAFYFGPGRSGSDPVSSNDGTLRTTPPAAPSGSDLIAFDGISSACDIQTDQWSAGLLALGFIGAGTTDPCDKNDVSLGAGPGSLTYTTAPFRTSDVVAGPLDATVYLTSTTTDTELAATVEAVSPSGQSLPLTSGALIGSQRGLIPEATWVSGDGLPLMPVHALAAATLRPIVPGQVVREDIQIFPTMAVIPAGWRLRVTITTGDSPHLLATLAQTPHLVGGLYAVQRRAGAASVLNVPLAPVGAFDVPCGAVCSNAGP